MQTGRSGTLSSINMGGRLGLRLRVMGLIPGSTVTVTRRAPLHGPVKWCFNDQTLSLRNNGADQIELITAGKQGE